MIRKAISLITATLLWAGILGLPLATTGCSKGQVAALVQEIGTSTATLASILGNPAVAGQIKADTTAAVTAITNWQSNPSASQTAIEAINIVENDLNLIPGLNSDPTVLALVTLSLGTLAGILALIPSSSVTGQVQGVRVSMANPPKTKAAFDGQWNVLVAGSSNPFVLAAKR